MIDWLRIAWRQDWNKLWHSGDFWLGVLAASAVCFLLHVVRLRMLERRGGGWGG